MAYARIENASVVEYPLYEGNIRELYTNISFPKPFNPPNGFVTVEYTEAPQITYLQNIAEGTPEKSGDKWIQTWVITDATAEEIAERTNLEASNVRADRNKRLADTDWRVTYEVEKAAIDGLGIQYPQVWADYRQALRDISSQPGFPHNVTWPEEPTT